MRIVWHEKAWDEYLYWQKYDKRMLKCVNDLLQDTVRNGHEGIGKPERLKGNLSGYYSKRIDGKNRLVYQITADGLEVISCKGHYSE